MKYDEIMSLTNLYGKFMRSSDSEREDYKKVEMYVTEKIDGENWRMGLENGRRFIGSRKHLFYWDEIAQEFIHDFTHKPHPNWEKINEETKAEIFDILTQIEGLGRENIVFYGELYGNGLQGHFKFSHDGYAIIYYEIAIEDEYIDQLEAFTMFDALGVKHVPMLGIMSLADVLELNIESIESQVATDPFIEGIVAVPIGGSYDWDFKDRFVVKKKIPKFAEQKQRPPRDKNKKGYESPFLDFVTENRLEHILQDLREDGHLYSGDKDFRILVVERMLENIMNEENNGEEFEKRDRKSLSAASHRLFGGYIPKME